MSFVKDFHPISLTMTTYKNLAKVLAERLNKVISSTVSRNQSASLQGRQMLDPIFIANEILEEYRFRKKGGWILKLDLEKAFDKVDWSFVLEVLRHKGFGCKWIEWIEGCIVNNNFSIFINGRPRGRIKASRGLRIG